MTLNQRTARSIGWRSGSGLFRAAILFIRSILLARLLPIELFGIFATVTAIRGLSGVVAGFGLDGALIQQNEFTADEDRAAATHFTLKLLFSVVWFFLLCLFGLLFFEGIKQLALIVVAGSTLLSSTTGTPRILLRKRVVHRRLSLLGIIGDVLSAVAAVGLALLSPTIWALLVGEVVTMLTSIVLLYLWRPVWRPKLALPADMVRYFLGFGKQLVGANLLLRALDMLDDLWTAIFLGDYLLGLYARAYTFASYPRRVIALPVDAVALGSYAELRHDREALSRMFFRINALLIRSGFFFAGILALVAPEFIRLVLGAKWLPMLDTFRLMLLFTLLDPIKVTVGDLFIGLGQPKTVLRARLVQLGVLLAGLFTLGSRFGIRGVAVTVNVMLAVGIGLLLMEARRVVDFSIWRLFAAPLAGLVGGMICGRLAIMIPSVLGSDYRTGLVKAVVFVTVYPLVLLALERRETVQMLQAIRRRAF